MKRIPTKFPLNSVIVADVRLGSKYAADISLTVDKIYRMSIFV